MLLFKPQIDCEFCDFCRDFSFHFLATKN